jgi:predicted lipoprotein with Yx(FWY)xxD motif
MANFAGKTTTPPSRSSDRTRAGRARLLTGATGLATLCLGLATMAGGTASAATQPTLGVGHSGTYGAVLVDSRGLSLYTLSNSENKMVCTGKCLSFWPPVVVSKSTTHVDLGPGVTGEIGFMPLTKTTKEVTFDGYPLYTFVKDTGPGQSHGEGVVAFGGTWELVRPAALVAPAAKAASGATTKAAASGTTTTTAYVYK